MTNQYLSLSTISLWTRLKVGLLMCVVLGISACSSTNESNSDIHAGQKYEVFLEDKSGNTINIGFVEKQGDKYNFERDDSKFKDFFLSMKEMKCLEGAEIFCHIHYPYPQNDVTEQNNSVWLSHELLFMYKRANQFGARLRQGVYFELVPDGDGFKGVAYSLDLDDLASPPDNLSIPPINTNELELLEVDERWLPYLKIKQM
ncbi:hypothetical protein [Glaciecola sp. MF2-115]|uniref:hypothetical protein n=1 Tax=Glaciecola sp. MF2-115 TaxID=3384827 RepID=UPI0039A23BDE